jgi:arylsulfatase A-like enzyme
MLLAAGFAQAQTTGTPGGKQPNIIFILADDAGYSDFGCYGQKKIRTPHIDRLAAEGTRFTQCYAGSTVCGPSRSVLMTGQHTGHTTVRGNGCLVGGIKGRMHLTEEDTTVARMLGDAGYRTGLVGKWHLDGNNPAAGPLDRGFDEFYGWLISAVPTHRPNVYFPPRRFRNRELLEIPENRDNKKGVYEPDLDERDALDFITNHKDRPFFLYLASNLPHSPLDIPDTGPYRAEKWPDPEKRHAAMVGRLDATVGAVMQRLEELGLENDTIVFFSSDNGPRSGNQPVLTRVADFFDSNGPLQGYKRDMYEGGIRVPMIVRWPGHVPAGRVSDVSWYFADFMPTACALAGTPPPEATVRWRQWKAIRHKPGAPLELYHLDDDLGEIRNVARDNPEVVSRIEDYLKTCRTISPNWPVKGL